AKITKGYSSQRRTRGGASVAAEVSRRIPREKEFFVSACLPLRGMGRGRPRPRDFSVRRFAGTSRCSLSLLNVTAAKRACLHTTTKPAVDSLSPRRRSGERGLQKSATIRWNEPLSPAPLPLN